MRNKSGYSMEVSILRYMLDGKFRSSIELVKKFGFKAQARITDLRRKGIQFETRIAPWDETHRFTEYKLSYIPGNLFVKNGSLRTGDYDEIKAKNIITMA